MQMRKEQARREGASKERDHASSPCFRVFSIGNKDGNNKGEMGRQKEGKRERGKIKREEGENRRDSICWMRKQEEVSYSSYHQRVLPHEMRNLSMLIGRLPDGIPYQGIKIGGPSSPKHKLKRFVSFTVALRSLVPWNTFLHVHDKG
ncbi:hypothetical protein H6P81_002542 [Aristolochia fimbriata]|uniref:Uncharacterized protein n=1 Tax=Aristolochia fimbriata TaxID=158543 RepID=A0AAV7FBU4_ARIFI|nr:hypothetical protein H6P81_002542 [Aristolochia fimbriata]